MKRNVAIFWILLIALIALANSATSQNNNTAGFDKRLEKSFDKEYLNNLKNNSPVTLELLNFGLDHAWYIADEMFEKINDIDYLYFKDITTGEKSTNKVLKIDFNNMNITEYFYEQNLNARTFYKVSDTNIIIGFYSLNEIADMFNKEKGLSHE